MPASTSFNFGLRIAKTAAGADVTAFLNDGAIGDLDLNATYSVLAVDLTTLSFDSAAFLMNGSLMSGADTTTFSDINVTTGVIPEPTSVLLLGLGSLLIGGAVRRRS